jgi:hypothetical protein
MPVAVDSQQSVTAHVERPRMAAATRRIKIGTSTTFTPTEKNMTTCEDRPADDAADRAGAVDGARYAAGLAAGRRWARLLATAEQLRYLTFAAEYYPARLGLYRQVFRRRGPAARVYGATRNFACQAPRAADVPEGEDLDSFWEHALGHDHAVERASDPDFARGFVAGATMPLRDPPTAR